ncbi:bidirectional sugar transporter SWEET3-like [Diospyros lotus]|uniref:bidirectional sugar transporter SWEET3-like n=1 Tax=Diospyros lotus TaxID=55363 RepID=UPI00224FB7C0|nr:bidirectional sugar transporter SWEET3-like [Diospyros lotus]
MLDNSKTKLFPSTSSLRCRHQLLSPFLNFLMFPLYQFHIIYTTFRWNCQCKKMGDRLRLVVGVIGNAASVLLYTAPILTFSRVIKKKSTGEFSCVPYIIALLNCFLYTWYGLPVVSYRWENFPVVTINGLGMLLELCFILIYFWFASAKEKRKVAMLTVSAVVVFCITAITSAFAFHDHCHRKVLVGSVGLVASIAMYGSPLVVVKQVIKTKSVEFMPFYLSFFSFLASSLWMAYGLLSHDLFLASPNLVGSPLGIIQLVLYCKYWKKGIMREPHNWDIEKDDDKTKQQLQLTVTEDTNGKI